MTYQERKSIVSLISAIVIFGVYSAYKFMHYPGSDSGMTATYRYWGTFVLVLTLVSIVAHIAIGIAFNLVYRMTTGEKEPGFADEMDKLIELKANRIGFLVFILGFLLAMGALVVEQPIRTMFVTLIVAGFVSDVAGSAAKLYHYRRGV